MPDTDLPQFEERLRSLMRQETGSRISGTRIESRARQVIRRRRAARRARTAGVALGLAAVTGGVVATAAGTGGGHVGAHHDQPTGPSSTSTTTTAPLAEVTSRMPGLVQVAAIAFPTPAHGVVLIQQCYPCQATSGTYTDWVAVTNDSGGSWTVRRTAMPLSVGAFTLSFADASNGWAEGGYVTHDGGLTWQKARVAARWPVGDVAVAGGEVWAVSSGCSAGGCGTTVLAGRAGGSSLSPVAGQPFSGSGYSPGTVVAESSSSAYIEAAGPKGIVLVGTQDGGSSWRTLSPPCPSGTFMASPLAADSTSSLWQLCETGKTVKTTSGTVVKATGPGVVSLVRSTDGGRRWETVPGTAPRGELRPQSSRTAWLWANDLWRTSDDGASWQKVWTTAALTLPAPGQTTAEALASPSGLRAETATAVSSASSTYIAVDETSDGGSTWQERVISLPSR